MNPVLTLVERLAGRSPYTSGARVALACVGGAILWHVLTVTPEVPFLYLELAGLPLTVPKVYLLHGVWMIAALGLITTRFTRECALVALCVYGLDAAAGLQEFRCPHRSHCLALRAFA